MSGQHPLAGKRFLFFLAGLELGGAERQALYLARHLKGLGSDVRVWGISGPGLAADRCDEAGIPWAIQPSIWPSRKRHWLRSTVRFLQTVRRLWRERPDAILAYTERPCVSSGLAWRWSPAKAFIWGQRDRYLRGGALERHAYRRASAVICNAEHEIEFLGQTLGETTAPIHVVHNGLELAPCQKTRTEWRAELNIPANAMVATMVANFRFQKDHPTLLRAWRILQDSIPRGDPRPRLLLAGARQESFASVHRLAADLGLLDSVSFLGQVQDISGLLSASDIGVLASPLEGLSNAVLEYMASGLPVVATDLPANREALGDDAHGQLYPNGDFDALANALRVLMRNPERRTAFGTRNRQRARTEFSIDSMCRAATEHIAKCLNGSIGARSMHRTLA